MNQRPPLLFVLNDTEAFGVRLSEQLDLATANHVERTFKDGEHKARSLENVRDRDVYVVQSLSGDGDHSVNDKLNKLLFFLGSVRDAGAGRVTAVVPYLCYARKDRKTKTRDPVTTRYVARMFESTGVDRLISMDVHNLAAFHNAFRIQTVHLEARILFANHVENTAGDKPVAVVSPDAGGVKRARKLQQTLERTLERSVPMAFMEKHRSMGEVTGNLFAGDVEGKQVVLFDDLISSGGTMVRTARECKNRGAKSVFAAATHGIFAGHSGETLADNSIDEIWISDSVSPDRIDDERVESKLTILESTGLFADAISRCHRGEDVVKRFALPDDPAYDHR